MRKNIRVKPSKSQSIIGFVMGICFVLIGLFVAIPQGAGLFGFIWTFLAASITVTHGINLFTKKGISSTNIEVDEANYNTSFPSTEERLLEVENLYRKGLISQDELEAKRKEILEKL